MSHLKEIDEAFSVMPSSIDYFQAQEKNSVSVSCYFLIQLLEILNVDGKDPLKISVKCLPWEAEEVMASSTRMNDTKMMMMDENIVHFRYV